MWAWVLRAKVVLKPGSVVCAPATSLCRQPLQMHMMFTGHTDQSGPGARSMKVLVARMERFDMS